MGPDLQFLVNPGEAFPGLVLGNPYGIEDASCDNRANPPVPTWHASAPFRFQVGLGDDMIGYEKPAWSFWDPAGVPADGHVCHRSAQPPPRPGGRGGRARGLERGRPAADRAARRSRPTRPRTSAWAGS